VATLAIDPTRAQYIKKQFGSMVGKTISQIRPLTEKECEGIYWSYEQEQDAFIVIFTDGSAFIPMADPEGNGAGFLFTCHTEAVS